MAHYIYLMYSRKHALYKIGYSSQPPAQRCKQVRQKRHDDSVQMVASDLFIFETEAEAIYQEGLLHERFKDRHFIGEWFSLTNEDLCQLGVEPYTGFIERGRWKGLDHLSRPAETKPKRRQKKPAAVEVA